MYLGNWSIILFAIEPDSPDFVLTISYQHPIVEAHGTDMFLYNLNIGGYLSNSSGDSTAHFNVLFQTNCHDIKVYTVPGQGATPLTDKKTPVNFTTSQANGTQTVAFNIVSNYSDQPHDQLVTFNQTPAQISKFEAAIIVGLSALAVTFMAALYFIKKKKMFSGANDEQNVKRDSFENQSAADVE